MEELLLVRERQTLKRQSTANFYILLLMHALIWQKHNSCNQEHDKSLIKESYPWIEPILTLFKDQSIAPEVIQSLSGVKSSSDISRLHSRVCLYNREGSVLGRSFAELESLYGTCLCHFEAGRSGDSKSIAYHSGGKSYILYTNFFFKRLAVRIPRATFAMECDAQKEMGLGDFIWITQRKNKSKGCKK